MCGAALGRTDRCRRFATAVAAPCDAGARCPAVLFGAVAKSTDVAGRDGSYVLQIGDEISVKAFRIPDVDETVRIRPDGKISLLLVPNIPTAGLSTCLPIIFGTGRRGRIMPGP